MLCLHVFHQLKLGFNEKIEEEKKHVRLDQIFWVNEITGCPPAHCYYGLVFMVLLALN